MFVLLACATGSSMIFFFIGVVVAECDRKTLTYTMDDMSDEIKKLKGRLHTEQQRVSILERENQNTRDANSNWYDKVDAMTGQCTDAYHAVEEVEQKLKATWVVLVFSIFMVGTCTFLYLIMV